MKKKDMVMLIVACAILLGAAYIGYTKLLSPKGGAAAGTSVELVGNVPATLDQTTITKLDDPTQIRDFEPSIDLTTGLGTATPFGN